MQEAIAGQTNPPICLYRFLMIIGLFGWYAVIRWWFLQSLDAPDREDRFLSWVVAIPATFVSIVLGVGILRALYWMVTGL